MAKIAKKNENRVLRSGKVLGRRATPQKARTTPTSKIGKATRRPVQRTLRQRTEPASVIVNLSHFDLRYAPAYANGRGGRQVTAVLGPGLAELASSGWSDAKGEALTKLESAQDKYRQLGLVAGHLLNARFGGLGDDPKNLTILSASGNHKHQAFDNAVAQAVGKLATFYDIVRRGGVAVSKFTYGIRVTISVSAQTWGNQGPDQYICDHLLCVAALTGRRPGFNKLDIIQRRLATDLLAEIENDLNQANDFRANGRIVRNTKR